MSSHSLSETTKPLTEQNFYDPRHSHEPEIPPALDAEGRCLVCRLLVKLAARDERIRATIPKLDGIIAATDTMGADYGIPTVARLAREAKRTLTEADNG